MNDIAIEEEIELAPAEDNLWYKFMVKSLELDKYAQPIKPRGWHWFWGIYEVYKNNPQSVTGAPIINLNEIKKSIPDSHWLNSLISSTGMGKPDKSLKEESVFILKSLLQEHNYSDLPQEIDFAKLRFKYQIDFSNFIFPMSVNFIYSEFPNYVGFNEAFFYRSADFIVTKFSGSSSFNNAKFVANVTFDSATFSSSASFHSTTFADDAVFNGAIFSKNATFTKATFARIASFDDTEFRDILFFPDATFTRGVTFTNAIFSHRAIFDQVTITGYTSFRHAEFKKYVPSFYKAKMYSNIIWDWDVKLWPQIDWSKINGNDEVRMIDNQNAYENLSSQMKGLDKYHDEHFFYRQEMCCRRWRSSRAVKFFYYLYEKLADYGYGIKQALWGWFWHMVLGAQAIAIVAFANACWKDGAWEVAKSMACSVPVSIANSHSFLFFNNGAFKGCYEYFARNNFFNTIWAFQTVLGIIFLFLLLLTLRIRFRLK